MNALCNHDAMAVWAVVRAARGGLDPAAVSERIGFAPARVARLLNQLERAGLLERRGAESPVFRAKMDELRVAYDGVDGEPLRRLFARWHDSRVEYFDQMLAEAPAKPATRPSGFCGSGSARLNSAEQARLRLLLQQIGNLMRNAAMRRATSTARPDEEHERTYAVLLRTSELASEPLPQPNILFERNSPSAASETGSVGPSRLSPRERQVAEALATGLSRPEIARQLGRSPHTIVTLSKRIYQKLAIRRRAELVRIMSEP